MAAPTQHRTRRLRARLPGSRGFTMVELMTVVSILAVMLGVLAPSFSQFLALQQAKALTYDLTSDLMLARNEALKRNVSISIARSGAGWEQGWGVATVATNESLSHRNPVTQSVSLSGAPASITFDPNGRVSSPLGSVRITISGGQNSR